MGERSDSENAMPARCSRSWPGFEARPWPGLTVVILVTGLLSPSGGQAAAAIPHFTDVTASSGIHVQGLGNASSWIDYDGDGDLDLFATNSDFPGRNYLYRNDGGVFTDVTTMAGLKSPALRSVAWGDFDNDGHPDLAATTYMSGDHARLFHNDGDGTFTDVSALAGFLPSSLPWRVAWADFDRDGLLDLFQANLSGPAYLYRNDGDGTFTEVGGAAGVSNSGSATDAAWSDYDGDAWPDLFVSDDGADHLYRNDGDGTFTDVTSQAGVSDNSDSVSACWGDEDADGRVDLYVVNIGGFGQPVANHLYRNDGDGTFTDVTSQAGVGDVGDGRTCNWVDVDADGRLDLFASDHIHVNRLYRNNGDGTFTDIAASSGLANPFDTFNATWGDEDGDGDLDVMVVGHDANALFANQGPTGGFLQLDLVGTRSNASAIGARAFLALGHRSPNRTVQGATGAYGQDSLTLEFGLGRAPGPFRARVLWPSGTVQVLTGLQANSRVQVIEPG